MPTVSEILRALQRAKAAGDTEAAALIRQDLIQTQRASDRAEYDPSAGMGRFEQARAGFGKAFVDLGHGVEQMGAGVADFVAPEERTLSGLVTGQKSRYERLQAEEADRRAMDAPLMNRGWAKTGNVLGNVAATAPAMFIPGANTLAGSSLVGAVTGAMQPTVEGESRFGNATTGAVVAPAAILAGRGIAAGVEGAKSLVEPFTKGGQQRIASRVFQSFAGDNPAGLADELARAPSPGLPGYTMTAAQAVDSPGLAQLERTLRNNPQLGEQWGRLDQANRTAILDSIRGIAKTPQELEAAIAARESTANALYGAARKQGADAALVAKANSETDRALAEQLRKSASAVSPNVDPNYGVTLFGPGARAAAEEAAQREAQGASSALLAQAGDLEKGAVNTGKSFVGGLNMSDLMNRPAIRSAIAGAKTTAANFGQAVDESNPVSVLHWAKMNLDDAIGAASRNGNKVEASALKSAQEALLKRLEDISPGYRAARETFATMSGPVNRMEVGQELLNKLEPALSQGSDVGTTGLTPATFARAVQNGESVVRKATGRNASLQDILTPDESGAVQGAMNALARRERVFNGKAVGSNTAQNMVSQNVLRSFLGPTGLPQGLTDRLVGNALTQSVGRGVSVVAKPAEEAVLNVLVEAAQNPQTAAMLLKQAGKKSVANRLLARLEATRALPVGALMLANAPKQ